MEDITKILNENFDEKFKDKFDREVPVLEVEFGEKKFRIPRELVYELTKIQKHYEVESVDDIKRNRNYRKLSELSNLPTFCSEWMIRELMPEVMEEFLDRGPQEFRKFSEELSELDDLIGVNSNPGKPIKFSNDKQFYDVMNMIVKAGKLLKKIKSSNPNSGLVGKLANGLVNKSLSVLSKNIKYNPNMAYIRNVYLINNEKDFISREYFKACNFEIKDSHNQSIKGTYVYKHFLSVEMLDSLNKEMLSKVMLSSQNNSTFDLVFNALPEDYKIRSNGTLVERGKKLQIIGIHKSEDGYFEKLKTPQEKTPLDIPLLTGIRI